MRSERRLAGPLALAGALAGAAARAEMDDSPWSQTVDLAVGVGSSRATGALSWNHFYGFFDQRLRVGLGARFASFFGNGATPYTTADASLIRANKVNTLTVIDPQANSLNAQFLIRFRVVAIERPGAAGMLDGDVLPPGLTRTSGWRREVAL